MRNHRVTDCIMRSNNRYKADSEAPDEFGGLKTECFDWENDEYSTIFENNTEISTLVGADLINVQLNSNPACQLTDVVQEDVTIDDAVEGASDGDVVTLPVFGRKAITENGGYWVTEVYDLNCRYVELYIADESRRDAVRDSITQYAVAQPYGFEVKIMEKGEYSMKASLGDVGTLFGAARSTRSGGRLTASARHNAIAIRLGDPSAYTLELVAPDGRQVLRTSGTASASVDIPTHSLCAGVYLLRVVSPKHTLTKRVSLH